MARYRVGLTQRVIEEATVYVDGETPADAKRIAMERARYGDIAWHYKETPAPAEAVSVKPIAEPIGGRRS